MRTTCRSHQRRRPLHHPQLLVVVAPAAHASASSDGSVITRELMVVPVGLTIASQFGDAEDADKGHLWRGQKRTV